MKKLLFFKFRGFCHVVIFVPDNWNASFDWIFVMLRLFLKIFVYNTNIFILSDLRISIQTVGQF